jgi:SAM-dependent methyltransferase
MQSNQDQVFAASEGDKWFFRNQHTLERFDPDTDFLLKLMDLYQLRPRRTLEVGSANGFRLAAIAERHGSKVIGVDPSSEAILHGKASFPTVEFVVGTAASIPLQECFDLIIVNSVFHWIDRTNLLRSIAEIDRLLINGGCLLLGDFLPSNLVKVRYHHLTDREIYTYKQSYAATFLASGLYHPLALLTWDHASRSLAADASEDDRFGAWLLRKSLNDLYVERSFQPGPGPTA